MAADDGLDYVALHDAGHCVMALAGGMRVLWVSLKDSPKWVTLERDHLGRRNERVEAVRARALGMTQFDNREAATPLARFATHLGGCVAKRIGAPETLNWTGAGRSDVAKAVAMLEADGHDDPETIESLIDDGTALTERLLRERWEHVERLTRKLERERHLIGARVELVDVPTSGRSRLVVEDLTREHLDRLWHWINHGRASHIFLSRGVARLLRTSGAFRELVGTTEPLDAGLAGWRLMTGKLLLLHYHFSAFGWQILRLREDLARIGRIVRQPPPC